MYSLAPVSTPIEASSISLAVPPQTEPGPLTTVVTLPSVVTAGRNAAASSSPASRQPPLPCILVDVVSQQRYMQGIGSSGEAVRA